MVEVKSVGGGEEFSGEGKVDRSTSLSRVPEAEGAGSGKRRKIEETLAEKNGTLSPDSGENLEKPEETASNKKYNIDEKNGSLPQEEGHLHGADAFLEENDDDDEEDEEDYSVEQDEDVDGGRRRVDVKGKGIAVDRKGKGKMMEDSEDEDSDCQNDDHDDVDDSSDDSDGDFSDGLDGSDVDEDPLAEVDLNNILPSRTRRSKSQTGFRINDKSEDA